MDNGQQMKFLKWVTFSILGLFVVFVTLTLHPDTTRNLEKNFRKNVTRSFEDSEMSTKLNDLKLSFWPLLMKWSLLHIARNSISELPNSLLQIFQSTKLSDCTLSINPGWFLLNAEIKCKKIDVRYLPLRWLHVANLNSALSLDFYFVHSDFRNLEGKQGWWNVTLKADDLIMNGKTIGPFHLNYYFSSLTDMVIEWPNLKEKMIIINEPEQLRVVHLGRNENYSFLSQGLYAEIKSLW